jgi:dihydrofolate reductase
VGKLIYSMSVSLDGFIAGPNGEIDWSVPDEELHRFHNARVRELGLQLCGRRLHEVMRYWDTADESTWGEVEHEFAAIWRPLPKVVFSRTLDGVEGNATLKREVLPDEIARLKEEVGGDIGVGGAGLASTLIELGLVDEFQLFVNPVTLGAGTPFFPPLDRRIDLELVETRTFGSRVVYANYARPG